MAVADAKLMMVVGADLRLSVTLFTVIIATAYALTITAGDW